MLSSDQLSDLIRKRFEIRIDPTLADSVSQGYTDGSGDFGTGILFDTVRGKKAGDFSFTESMPDLDDLFLEIAYRGDVDSQIDRMMNSFREGDEDSGQERFNSIAEGIADEIRSQPYTPDTSIPIIHGGLNSKYRGQGLYRRLILPTLIDYFGDYGLPLGSGRYNRSLSANRAHTALQNMNDPRIRHTLEMPFNADWGEPNMLIDMATQSRLDGNSEFVEDLLSGLPEKTFNELSQIQGMSPVDIYERRMGSKNPGWGDLRLSPRRLPVVEQDWDEFGESRNNYSIYDLAEMAARGSGNRWNSQNQQSKLPITFEKINKSFPLPEFWHGTSAANAEKILEEGLDPYSFGSPHEEDAEDYADYHDAPAILGFDTDEGHTLLDPHNEGYDFGTSDYGHVIVEERVPPELIRLFAMGHEGISNEAWYDLLRVLHVSDSLSRQYPDIDEAYNKKR